MIQFFADDRPDILGRYGRLIDEHQRLRGIALGQHGGSQQTESTTADDSERQNPPVVPKDSPRFGNCYLAILDHLPPRLNLSQLVPSQNRSEANPSALLVDSAAR